jgi:low affinity Fe/Cu permease
MPPLARRLLPKNGRRLHMREEFRIFAHRIAEWVGSPTAFVLGLGIIVLWALAGPLFDYSDTWQLVVNTGTTIVTFLMVFLIQRSQNKESLALQLKLNELVAAMHGASNRLIDIEDLDEDELRVLQHHFRTLSKLAKQDDKIGDSHSVEEAETRHRFKRRTEP